MRTALVLALSLALALQATAQTPQRRPFADTDYEAYFSEGDFHAESPTFQSVSTERIFRRDKTLMLSFVEVMSRWDRASPYPFVKVRSEHKLRLGVPDKALKARTYKRTDADFDDNKIDLVWLSRNDRTTISSEDVFMGSVRDHYKTMSRAAGRNPEADDDAYRRDIVSTWTYRCDFVDGDTYEVECVDTNLKTRQSIVRRFRKQAGMS